MWSCGLISLNLAPAESILTLDAFVSANLDFCDNVLQNSVINSYFPNRDTYGEEFLKLTDHQEGTCKSSCIVVKAITRQLSWALAHISTIGRSARMRNWVALDKSVSYDFCFFREACLIQGWRLLNIISRLLLKVTWIQPTELLE